MKQMENEMNVNVPLEVIKASEIEPKEVKWLWYPYIPFGKVTLLQGDPGDGKSKLMLSIAALLSKGEPLPFTEEETEPMQGLTNNKPDFRIQVKGLFGTEEKRFEVVGGDKKRPATKKKSDLGWIDRLEEIDAALDDF